MSNIDDKISIEVCTRFETFKLCFEKYDWYDWDWSKDISNSSIEIILKTKNQASKNINQDIFDITSSIGILSVMEQSRNIQLENAIKQIETKNVWWKKLKCKYKQKRIYFLPRRKGLIRQKKINFLLR
jgi:hypothetical protein